MPGIFDNQSIDIPCPDCGHKVAKTIAWLKTHRDFTCRCGARVSLDPSQLRGQIAKVDRAFDDFKRTMGKLGR